MHISASHRYAAIAIALGLLSGCSGGTPQGAPAIPQDAARSLSSAFSVIAAPKTYVFASDYTGNSVDVFTRATQTGRLTGFQEPEGMATDGSGTLYVADTNHRSVKVYAPPYPNTPTATIADPNGFPTTVAVARTGLVAVVNICNGANCNLPATVNFYSKGNTTSPCAIVPIFQTGLAGSFDDSGNLYVGGLSDLSRSQVGVVRGGCSAKAVFALVPSFRVQFVGGILIDTHDDIAVLDGSVNQVDIFAPPAKGSMTLTLLSTAPLQSTGRATGGLALSKDGTRLYIADFKVGLISQVEEYAYPAGGLALRVLSTNPPCLCEGIATSPAGVP